MGYLDNLEDSLKSLESQEERDGSAQKRREDDLARVLAVAPWAETLKNSGYTKRLFDQAAIEGHRLRTKIYMAWVESTLRLEARGRTLELRPTADGIVASRIEPDRETDTEPLDLSGEPEALLKKWLG